MPLETVTKRFVLPISPSKLFADWISSEGHTAMTGSTATFSEGENASFTAWGGYIQGTVLETVPSSRIVLSWRTLEFPPDAEHSRVEITLQAVEGGTQVDLFHSHIPEGQGVKYDGGWDTHYIKPMQAHYSQS